MATIDLVRLTRDEVTSLSGHNRGLAARRLYNLDQLDQADENITVIAPAMLDAITPSFVQGMFAGSVHTLGEQTFYRHYNFDLPAHLLTDIRLGVQRALMRREIAGAA